jgi:hypothetical protein
VVDRLSKRPYNTDIDTKELTMLKMIGIVTVVYLGWVSGLIQSVLLITAGLLTVIAGA